MLRLQSIIASLSGVLTPQEVAETVLVQAMEALRADAGSVVTLTDDESGLERVCALGYPAEALAGTGHYAFTDPLPAAEAMQSGEAVWIPSLDAWKERYPAIAALQEQFGFQAAACIPLIAHGRKLGILALSFRQPLKDSEADRAFALTLAQQCAQALDRARLYAAERAARALAERERARLHDLFMRAPARIALARGPDHIYEFANELYVAELDDPDIVGKPAREVFPEAEDQGIIAAADRVFATGEPFIAREALFQVDRDGDGSPEQRYFNVAMQPSPGPDGTIDGVMLFSVDVTEAVRSRQWVEELLAQRNAILSQIADGLILVDAGGQIMFANEAAREVFGFDATGRSLRSLTDTLHFSANDSKGVRLTGGMTVERAMQSGEVIPFEQVLTRGGDTRIIIQGSVAPVTGDDGDRMGVVATFRDVTAQRTLERQKDDFLAAAAHDLKTPLTTIKGVAQILQRRVSRWKTPEGEHLLRDLERIDGTVSKMNLLLNKLLDITRLQMDQPLSLEKRRRDLVPLVRGVIEDQQQASHRHAIRFECDSPQITGVFDGFRIERVITNLLSNSIRYSPKGGEILVELREVHEGGVRCAVLTVRDHGLGIPASDVPHIFDRFYRAGNVEGKIQGAGIGLAGVRQIVQQHGGSIVAQSEEGCCTTFTVHLPLDG